MPGPTEPLGRASSQGTAGQSGGTLSAGNRVVFTVKSQAPNGAWNVVIRSAAGGSSITATVVLKTGSDGAGRSGIGMDPNGRMIVGRVIVGGAIPTIEVAPRVGGLGVQSVADARFFDAAIRVLSAGGLPVTDALVSVIRSAHSSRRVDERTMWLLGVFRDKGFGFEPRDIENLLGFIHRRDTSDTGDDRSQGNPNRRRREKNYRRDELLRVTRDAIRRASELPKNTLQFFNHARGSGYHWIIVPFAVDTGAGKIDAVLTAALLPHRKKVAGARLSVTFNDDEYSFAWKPPPKGEMEVSFSKVSAPTIPGVTIDPDRAAAALERIFGPRGFTRISVYSRDADDGFSIPGVRGIIPQIDESV